MPLPRFAGHGMKSCCSPALEQICVTPGLERAVLLEFSVLPEFSACHFQVPPTELASSESSVFSKWPCWRRVIAWNYVYFFPWFNHEGHLSSLEEEAMGPTDGFKAGRINNWPSQASKQ